MRPTDTHSGVELYECFECGRRVESPESKKCTDCGGELRHLGKPRDL